MDNQSEFNNLEDRRRLHNSVLIATVEKLDWDKRKFRAKRGEILTNWLPMPAFMTNNFKYWYPLRKGCQIVMNAVSGDLNTASVVGMLWSDDHKAPEVPISDRPTTELLQFEDGTEIRYDAIAQVIVIDTPCDINIIAKDFNLKAKNINLNADNINIVASNIQMSASAIAFKSASLTHNGVNIGATHTHPGVKPGPVNTGGPI
ncbi:phage baseplate assembly protein V [Psychrobacter celer]|uniref:phage baseplate assembly protein V n=1 Tax=Psychrobacter celer TaxID=306572 RepID=UPI003FD55D5C